MSLQYFFGSINSIQIIVYQNLSNIIHPANYYNLIRIVRSVVDCDIYDPEWTTKLYIPFDYDEEIGSMQSDLGDSAILKTYFKDFELETFNPILNIGGLFVVFQFYFLLMLFYIGSYVYLMIRYYRRPKDKNYHEGGEEDKMLIRKRRNNSKCGQMNIYLFKHLYCGFIIRITYESIIQFTLSSLLYFMRPILGSD